MDFLHAVEIGNDQLAESLVLQLSVDDAQMLQTSLASANADLRWWAIRGLALIGDEASVPSIVQFLAGSDPLMRATALLTLAALHKRQPRAIQPYFSLMANCLADEDGTVRQSASDALAQCGDDAIPVLVDVLKGDHQGARTRAAQALRQIETMAAAGVLYRCLNDSNYMVHTYAYEALEKMGLLETMLLVV